MRCGLPPLVSLHLLDGSSRCWLEGDEPLLLSGVGGLHGRRRRVLDVLLLLRRATREARRGREKGSLSRRKRRSLDCKKKKKSEFVAIKPLVGSFSLVGSAHALCFILRVMGTAPDQRGIVRY